MSEDVITDTQQVVSSEPLIAPVEKKAKAKRSVNTPSEDQLVGLIQHLASSVETLTNGLKDIQKDVEQMKESQKAPEPATRGPLDIGVMSLPATPVQQTPLTDEEFFSQVPVNLLAVARKTLGDKFKFRCVASNDSPHFTFTVIVPPEYSQLPIGQIDQRSKVIANSAGPNGVKEWCDIVKSNVIKFLGNKLPVNGDVSL